MRKGDRELFCTIVQQPRVCIDKNPGIVSISIIESISIIAIDIDIAISISILVQNSPVLLLHPPPPISPCRPCSVRLCACWPSRPAPRRWLCSALLTARSSSLKPRYCQFATRFPTPRTYGPHHTPSDRDARVQGDWPRIPRLRAVDGSKTVLPRCGVQAQIAQANANLTAANTYLNTTEKKLDKAIAAATVRRHAEP